MTVLPPGHPPFKVGKIGVLLINLGTPEGTSYWPMRRYLKEFLSDRRVIEVNPVLWWVLLNGIILSTRPRKSGHAYEQIWNRELNESPLKTITRSQSDKLAARLAGLPQVIVDWGMRYGLPPVGERIAALKDQGCDRILLFPL
jgi:ferrochelatase